VSLTVIGSKLPLVGIVTVTQPILPCDAMLASYMPSLCVHLFVTCQPVLYQNS